MSLRERATGTARWLWRIPAVTIRSPLPPTEAIRRIGWSFDAPLGAFMLFSRRGRVLGRIEGTRFKMVVRSFGNGSYPRPYCNGEVVPDGGGSLIAWDFDMALTRVFLFWFALFGLALLPVSLAVTLADPRQGKFLLTILGIMLAGLLVFWWVRSQQNRDAWEIRGILEGAVEADPPV
jgi:hypothetical protein